MVRNKKIRKFLNRYTALIIVSMCIFSVLLIKLVYMQVLNHQYYLDQSNNDSIKEITEPGPRGDIVDKDGAVLATDHQSYNLTFMETEESKKLFFETMEKVFNNLDSKAEPTNDTFTLKINPYRFDFNTEDSTVAQNLELRFKKDRGLDEAVIHSIKSLNDKKWNDLSLSQQATVNAALLKITPEETFNLLWKQYTDWYFTKKSKVSQATKDKINNYSIEEKRRFMVILDALKMQSFSGYKPVVIAENIKRDTAFAFQEKFNELPGVDITEQPKRSYPNGDLASAVLGNVSRISADNEEKYEEKGYDVNTDLIGVAGIEGVLETRLKGTKGEKLVEVNKMGRIVKEKYKSEPYPGQKVQLTISSPIQSVAEKALDQALLYRRNHPREIEDVDTTNANRGAVVVLNVKTGEVLALVSKPGFDPNLFTDPSKITPDVLKQYYSPDYEKLGRAYIEQRGLLSLNPGLTEDQLLDKLFPVDTSSKSEKPVRKDLYDIFPKQLYNYATSSLIPPGSSFKPVTAVAGLETGTITPNITFDDEGSYGVGLKTPILFPADGRNGTVDLKQAIAKSSNPYFMDLGRKLKNSFGDDILADYAWKYGLGVKPNSGTNPSTGIEIHESFGQVYNTWSYNNICATSFSIQTMEALKKGNGHPVIDLYENINDTKEVKKIKSDIINKFKDSIKTANFDSASYKDLLKKLVETDDSYKGKTFKSSDFKAILAEIQSITVYTGHSEATTPGNMYNASIGQGMSLFTPLQLADYVATLVNGGNRYKVHLVNKIFDADGTLVEDNKPEVLNPTGVSQSTIDSVKSGMESVTTEGTAAAAFVNFKSFMSTGGKTGSATFRNDQATMGRTSYSFFVGFAPYDNPEIAVCAVMFDGGYGSSVAPVVRDVYEAYFKDQLKSKGYVPPDDFVQALYNK